MVQSTIYILLPSFACKVPYTEKYIGILLVTRIYSLYATCLTLNQRKAAGVPANLILVYGAGDGTCYAIDTSQVDSEGENPVVAYGVDGGVSKVSDNFGSFLLSELQTVL